MEAIPKGLTGPSPRDMFFCIKAGLIMLFWDGENAGTGELLRYFEQQATGLI